MRKCLDDDPDALEALTSRERSDEDCEVELGVDRRLIFVRKAAQWEDDRRRIIEQLERYGYPVDDRMSISVALDETLMCVLERRSDAPQAMIAYSISALEFRVFIRFPQEAPPESTGDTKRPLAGEEYRWLLATACMSGLELSNSGREINMWKANSAAPARGRDAGQQTL